MNVLKRLGGMLAALMERTGTRWDFWAFNADPRKGQALERPPTLGCLDDDSLSLVFQQVSHSSLEDLLSVSRVNHRFYFLAVPWIYRNITIDYSKVTTLLLMKRLVQRGSKLPSYIRVLEIIPTETASSWFFKDVKKLLRCLTNVKVLTLTSFWPDYYLIIPELEKFQKSTIVVNGVETDLIRATSLNTTAQRIHEYQAWFHNGHFRRISFRTLTKDQIFPNFKADLLTLLYQNPMLVHFSVTAATPLRHQFRNMTEVFRSINLPMLEHLSIHGWPDSIFDEEELGIWGQKTGWKDLRCLEVDMNIFMAFIGKTPVLNRLELCVNRPPDLDSLMERFTSMVPEGTRQSSVTEFIVETPYDQFSEFLGFNSNHASYWRLLLLMPNLLSIRIGAGVFGRTDEIRTLTTMTVSNIWELRKACPDIQHLRVDIKIRDGWPYHILNEIARFKDLRTVTLKLHFVSMEEAKSMMDQSKCTEAFDYIRSIRENFGYGTEISGSEIHFDVAGISHNRPIDWTSLGIPHWAFQFEEQGGCWMLHKEEYSPSQRRSPDYNLTLRKLSLEALLRKKHTQEFLARCAGPLVSRNPDFQEQAAWKLREVQREIQRRKIESAQKAFFEADEYNQEVALFDKLHRMELNERRSQREDR